MIRKLMQIRFKLVTTFLVTVITLTACDQQNTKNNPLGYNLEEPEKFVMPETLLEISGIAFRKGKADTIYAIQDEEGKVFRLAWGIRKQYHSKFGRSGDYEDLSFLGDKVIVLKSNGQLFSFPADDLIYSEVDSVQQWEEVLPKGEYESLFGDEASGKLYVLCKNCSQDNNKDEISGYILNMDGNITASGTFSIDVRSIKAITGKVKRGFRPSALAKNPADGNWYIVSAVNKLLVIADAKWKIIGAYPLDGNRFYQPEGIAFDQNGNMYISNEGDDISEGNVLRFMRKP